MTTINGLDLGLSGSTGTGSFVGSTSPTLVTPALGTPTSGVITNCTGGPTLTSATLVTSALGTPSSGNLANCTGYPNAPYSNVVISSSNSGTFSTTNTSLTAVTNLTVTITTLGGPVLLMLQSGSTSNPGYLEVAPANVGGFSAFFRGVTQLNYDLWSETVAVGIAIPSASFQFIDTPTAGTYTYTVQVAAGSGAQVLVYYCNLVAMEI